VKITAPTHDEYKVGIEGYEPVAYFFMDGKKTEILVLLDKCDDLSFLSNEELEKLENLKNKLDEELEKPF
jgi:hypothetical protein